MRSPGRRSKGLAVGALGDESKDHKEWEEVATLLGHRDSVYCVCCTQLPYTKHAGGNGTPQLLLGSCAESHSGAPFSSGHSHSLFTAFTRRAAHFARRRYLWQYQFKHLHAESSSRKAEQAWAQQHSKSQRYTGAS